MAYKNFKNITKNDKLIIISGPTAVGKTSLSISLAKELDGEIISCDSMQVYKNMDIGTAKPTVAEMDGVPHHLIDFLSPFDEFSVATFKQLVFEKIDEIKGRNKVPILCGGTGFYTNAIIYNTEFTEMEKDDDYREYLNEILETKGIDYLYNMLKEVDEDSLKTIHKNNTKKVIRALEFNHLTGEKMSEHNETEKKKEPFFNVFHFVLDIDRSLLYDRINKRVDLMFDDGLYDEVNNLLEQGATKELQSMQGIGYKEFFGYFDNEYDLETCKELIKQNSRNYAKRQLTWFRNKSNANWISVDNLVGYEVLVRLLNVLTKEGYYE